RSLLVAERYRPALEVASQRLSARLVPVTPCGAFQQHEPADQVGPHGGHEHRSVPTHRLPDQGDRTTYHRLDDTHDVGDVRRPAQVARTARALAVPPKVHEDDAELRK